MLYDLTRDISNLRKRLIWNEKDATSFIEGTPMLDVERKFEKQSRAY